IARAGHEIASHGMDHRRIHRLGPAGLRRDLRTSRCVLEDLTGRPVIGYRAPTFSLTHETAWAIDVLVEAGCEYDCSVFPIHHDRYGVPDAPPEPHVAVGPGGGEILEIPPLTMRAMGVNWPVGGGGYFRLLPRWVIHAAVRGAHRRGQDAMVYLHPWELDPRQPVLNMPPLARWRHRVNLRGTADKLRELLRRFRFVSVADCLASLKERTRRVHRYGRGPRRAAGSP
ncbi:MAG TPA: polysaccharide deacetylase family protein, partial [Phycisphaerae bacterium]|nr:polysaccharide deacetylase family protein [Phycisphaerae bacterium]